MAKTAVEVLTDRANNIEWHECTCCGEQGPARPLDTLRRSGLECYGCVDEGCGCSR